MATILNPEDQNPDHTKQEQVLASQSQDQRDQLPARSPAKMKRDSPRDLPKEVATKRSNEFIAEEKRKKEQQQQHRELFPNTYAKNGEITQQVMNQMDKFEVNNDNSKVAEFEQHDISPLAITAYKSIYGHTFLKDIPIDLETAITAIQPIFVIAQIVRHVNTKQHQHRHENGEFNQLTDLDVKLPTGLVPLFDSLGECKTNAGVLTLAYPRTQLRQLAIKAIRYALRSGQYRDIISLAEEDVTLLSQQAADAVMAAEGDDDQAQQQPVPPVVPPPQWEIESAFNQHAVIHDDMTNNADLIHTLICESSERPKSVRITNEAMAALGIGGIQFQAMVPKNDEDIIANVKIMEALNRDHDGLGHKIKLSKANKDDYQAILQELGFSHVVKTSDEQIVLDLKRIYTQWQVHHMKLNAVIPMTPISKITQGCAHQAILAGNRGKCSSYIVYNHHDYYMADIMCLTKRTINGIDKVRTTTQQQDRMLDEYVQEAIKR